MMLLVVAGLLLLASPWLPVGLALIWLGWWVYERSTWSIAGSEGAFIGALMVLGGLGALAAIVSYLFGGDFTLPGGDN